MQELHLGVKILEYKIKTGGFEAVIAGTMYTDMNTSAKEIFENMVENFHHDVKNKFFIMDVEGTVKDEFSHNFYSIRTNTDSKIEDIQIISPNNLDKELLVDAILGSKISDRFASSCTDAVIKKCIVFEDKQFKWSSDAYQRLQKVNSLRLKEYYKKLKS